MLVEKSDFDQLIWNQHIPNVSLPHPTPSWPALLKLCLPLASDSDDPASQFPADTCWNTVQWHLSWLQTTVIMWYCMFWREIIRVGLSIFLLRRVFLSFPTWENSLGISHLQHLRWHVAHHLLSLFHCLPVGTGEQNGTSQGWHDLWVNTSYVFLCCYVVDL
jgi:hypothetical protein